MATRTDLAAHRELITGMMRGAEERPAAPKEGYQRCFYTLWGRENEITWESVANEDLIAKIVPGTGRNDWLPLSPFDLLPDIVGSAGGFERKLVYKGEAVRVSAAHAVGPQAHFERAGDYDTIFFQFAGYGLVETSFGQIALEPGEALLIPAMVAHRTIGSVNCRRIEYHVRDLVEVHLNPSKAQGTTRFRVYPDGRAHADEGVPAPSAPQGGRIREHLTRWDDLPGDDCWFERLYEGLVGKADSGRRPVKLRPFDHFVTTQASDGSLPAVRTALLWDSATFRQRVYSNPGRQPAPHRGYDEDELWFQFVGPIQVETEHAAYTMESGVTSMAEAGISHTSVSTMKLYRLTTYSPKPIRLVVKPEQRQRQSKWIVEKI